MGTLILTDLIKVDIETIRERYVGWDPIIEKMLTKVASHLRWGLFQLEPLPTWVSSTGKVALLGDAAHAMLPFLAQVCSYLEALLCHILTKEFTGSSYGDRRCSCPCRMPVNRQKYS